MPSRHAHLYRTARWKKERAAFLARRPHCTPCSRAGRQTRATLVHHMVPHKGNEELFFDQSNWEGRCSTCHSDAEGPEKTGRREYYRGCDVNGVPLDPKHRWRAE